MFREHVFLLLSPVVWTHPSLSIIPLEGKKISRGDIRGSFPSNEVLYFFFELSTFLFFCSFLLFGFSRHSHILTLCTTVYIFPEDSAPSVVALRGDWHVWDCLARERDDVDVIRLCACSVYKGVRVISDIILYFIPCSLARSFRGRFHDRHLYLF